MHSLKLVVAAAVLLTTFSTAQSARTAPSNPATPPVNRPQPPISVTPPRVVPNAIASVKMLWDGPYLGNMIRFEIQGVSTNLNPKCVVAITYSRAPNALFPTPFSVVKEFTLPSIPTLLVTPSMDKSGDWTVDFKPVKECTGKGYQFKATVPATTAESEPKILGVSGGGSTPILTNGMTGQITISGKGDLANCKVELSVVGQVANQGVKIINMNGALVHQEPFTVSFPTSNAPGFLQGSSSWVSLTIKTVSGCTLQNGGMENKTVGKFQVWNSL